MALKQLRTALVTVTTAGTRVRFSSTKKVVKGLTVKAVAANAGAVFVGDSTVAAANGYSLAAGITLPFEVLGLTADDAVDLNTLWLDAATNGDKATIAYLETVDA